MPRLKPLVSLMSITAISVCSIGCDGDTAADAAGETPTDAAGDDSGEDASSSGGGDTDTNTNTDADEPTDCTALCAAVFACGLEDEGTEAECVATCEDNPALFPPRVGACAEAHLASGQCDEEAFLQCAEGPVLPFFRRTATSICGRLFACCPSGSQEMAFEDEVQCKDFIVGLAGGFINLTEMLGYLVFDEVVGNACALKVEEVLTSTACESLPMDLGQYMGELEACEGLMQPQQGQGDPCGFDLGGEDGFISLSDGCISGLFCQAHGDQMPTCEPALPEGGDCSAEGTQCLSDDECVDGVCVSPLELGAACLEGWQCQSGACEEDLCVGRPLACNE